MNRTARHLAALATIATLAAPPWHWHRPPAPPTPLHVATTGAWLCEGTLIVRYGLERLDGREWAFRQDDGAVHVQKWSPVTPGSTQGRWDTLPGISGGEGVRRVPSAAVAPLDKVRTVRADATRTASSARLVTAGCPSL